jgi:hypothetical protein
MFRDAIQTNVDQAPFIIVKSDSHYTLGTLYTTHEVMPFTGQLYGAYQWN